MALKITAADLKKLTAWDTPTICNALEIVAPARRALGYTVEHLHCFDAKLKPICGYARTATIRAVHPSTLSAADAREQRARYYEYIDGGPKPSVVVIQDIDAQVGYGAFWGEVQTTIHKALGAQGVVTNGSVRDLDAAAPGFQMLAGRIGPSHAWVHLVDFATTVNVFGMLVRDGDIVHADRHGAVVVPAEVVKEVPKAVDLLVRREKVILDAAKKKGFNAKILRKAMADAAEIH